MAAPRLRDEAVISAEESAHGLWAHESEPTVIHSTAHSLLLNLAIGGNWPGNEADDPPLPATMLID